MTDVKHTPLRLAPAPIHGNRENVTEFNVGQWCLSEDECIAAGINFSAYERGVADAAEAFSRNAQHAFIESRAKRVWGYCAPYDATIKAFALCWPNDPNYLLFVTHGTAEENRKWFSKNYKLDRNGNSRGEPFVVPLVGTYNTAPESAHVVGSEEQDAPSSSRGGEA